MVNPPASCINCGSFNISGSTCDDCGEKFNIKPSPVATTTFGTTDVEQPTEKSQSFLGVSKDSSFIKKFFIYMHFPIYIIFLGSHEFLKFISTATSSKSWPTVQGVISSSISLPKYSYSVDGNQYTSGNIFFGGNNLRINDQPAFARKRKDYPENMQVIVYYDPLDPSNAVLEPGISKTILPFFLFVFMAPMILPLLLFLQILFYTIFIILIFLFPITLPLFVIIKLIRH